MELAPGNNPIKPIRVVEEHLDKQTTHRWHQKYIELKDQMQRLMAVIDAEKMMPRRRVREIVQFDDRKVIDFINRGALLLKLELKEQQQREIAQNEGTTNDSAPNGRGTD